MCDDELGVVGTINLDYRSLYLHFEDGVWICRNKVVMDIEETFVGDVALLFTCDFGILQEPKYFCADHAEYLKAFCAYVVICE